MAAVGDVMYIGSQSGVWRARWVGGSFVYNFSQLLTQSGPRSAGCMASLGDVCAVLTLNDLLIMDESSEASIAIGRMSKLLRQFNKAFLTYIPSTRQLYIFYQLVNETGYPHALIWDRDTNTFGQRDLSVPIDTAAAIVIPVLASPAIYDTAVGSYDEQTGFYDPLQTYTQSVCAANADAIWRSGPTPGPWSITRTMLPGSEGDAVRVRSLEVEIDTQGDQTIAIRYGVSDAPGAPITWGQQRSYPANQGIVRHDDLMTGRFISWQVSGVGTVKLNAVRLYFTTRTRTP
jgi:hypothetical protein